VIYNIKDNEEIEDLSYFSKDGSIVSSIALCDKGSSLITLTYNRDKRNAYLNNFNVNSEKLMYCLEFPETNPSGDFPPIRELPTSCCLIEEVSFLRR